MEPQVRRDRQDACIDSRALAQHVRHDSRLGHAPLDGHLFIAAARTLSCELVSTPPSEKALDCSYYA